MSSLCCTTEMGRNYLCKSKSRFMSFFAKIFWSVGRLEDMAPIDFFFKIERLVCDQALTPKQIQHFFNMSQNERNATYRPFKMFTKLVVEKMPIDNWPYPFLFQSPLCNSCPPLGQKCLLFLFVSCPTCRLVIACCSCWTPPRTAWQVSTTAACGFGAGLAGPNSQGAM